MRSLVPVILSIATLLYPHASVFSQEQITVGMQTTGMTDTTPPSVPTGLSASPVSSSQIQLSWNASTDNIAVEGYNIFRDTSFLASTTLTNFLDTGLASSTLYAYTVSAFDTSTNESARSATSSATTPAEDAQPPTGGAGDNIEEDVLISDVDVTVGSTTATIRWTTDLATRGSIAWGETAEYEHGTAQKLTLGANHEFSITELTPGTTYFFEARAEPVNGETARHQGTFTTLSVPDTTPPANPSDFSARSTEPGIELTWSTPLEDDFDGVRIVRSDQFYPVDLTDGEVIYEGESAGILDINVLPGVRYYYTLFAYDKERNYSSGVVASAVGSTDIIVPTPQPTPTQPSGGGASRTPRPTPQETTSTTTEPIEDLPVVQSPHQEIESLTLTDFVFRQHGEPLQKNGNRIIAESKTNIDLTLDYNRVPKILKTITFTLYYPNASQKPTTVLLRTNETKTDYQSLIQGINEVGSYQYAIQVIDYKNQAIKRLEGTLLVIDPQPEQQIATEQDQSFFGFIFSNIWFWILLLILLIIMLVLMFLFLRWKKNEEDAQYEDEMIAYPTHH